MPTIANFISILLLIAQKDKLSISALPQRDNGRGVRLNKLDTVASNKIISCLGYKMQFHGHILIHFS